MAQRSPTFLSFLAGAAIGPSLIVKIGAADNTVLQATASTEDLLGVSAPNIPSASVAAGDRIDVACEGVVDVIAGASITRGQWVTADANGKATPVGAVAGTNYATVGKALASASPGDFVPVLLAIGRVQG